MVRWFDPARIRSFMYKGFVVNLGLVYLPGYSRDPGHFCYGIELSKCGLLSAHYISFAQPWDLWKKCINEMVKVIEERIYEE